MIKYSKKEIETLNKVLLNHGFELLIIRKNEIKSYDDIFKNLIIKNIKVDKFSIKKIDVMYNHNVVSEEGTIAEILDKVVNSKTAFLSEQLKAKDRAIKVINDKYSIAEVTKPLVLQREFKRHFLILKHMVGENVSVLTDEYYRYEITGNDYIVNHNTFNNYEIILQGKLKELDKQ